MQMKNKQNESFLSRVIGKFLSEKKAFSLIELLAVMSIIGVLTAMVLPKYRIMTEKARMTEAITTMYSIQRGIDMYLDANDWPTSDVYIISPNSTVPLDIDVMKELSCNSSTGWCKGKFYQFQASCNTTDCTIQAQRTGVFSLLQMTRGKNDDDWGKVVSPDASEPKVSNPLSHILEMDGWTRN